LALDEDFSILDTKEECFMASLSRLVEGMWEVVEVEGVALEVVGLVLEASFARIEVRFLPVVGACRVISGCHGLSLGNWAYHIVRL
jgi:hypothetical protein